jgi:hypothetical protein
VLALEIGPLTVPLPFDTLAEQQPPLNGSR